MATPPVMFGEIPKHLKEADLVNGRKRSRIVIEKPIGDVRRCRQGFKDPKYPA